MHARSILIAALAGASLPAVANAATTFLVTVPASTPASDTVFIAGDFQGWNPGHPAYALAPQPDGRRAITLDLPNGVPIQFKFTRGTWAKVEKGPNGEEIANRTHTPSGNQTLPLTVARWADQGTITGHVETFSTPAFLGGRRCWVYLPPGYHGSQQRYPVLYMHDGQNLFDVRTSFAGEWQVDEAAETLIGTGELAPFIVVGIENSPARITEYTPWPDPGFGGGGGGAYLASVAGVLVPAIDAAYRTLAGPANRWMAGSSLGGLITAYAAYAHDDVWGRVAAVSPSYWWSNRAMLNHAAAEPKPAVERFYQDIGTGEGASAVQNLEDMRAILVSKGFVEGTDLRSVVAPGAAHNEFYWAQRMPDILRFIGNPPAVTAIESSVAPRAALELRLGPNPALANVTMDLTLPHASVVTIDVFDVRGVRVRSLGGRPFAAGRHPVRWDLRAASGARVGAGIYWVRASDGASEVTRAVVVLQ